MTPKETTELLIYLAIIVVLTATGFVVMGPWVNVLSIPSSIVGSILLARRHDRIRESE